MPLEIRELNIKVNVGGQPAPGGSGPSAPPQKSAQEEGDDKEQNLARAVDEVMAILRNRKER